MLTRIGRSFAAQLVRLAVSFADRFLVVAVLLRAWGADVYAEWALILSFAGLVAVAELGLNIHYGNIWQKAFVEGDEAGFQRMISVALGCTLGMGTLVSGIALIVATIVDLPHWLSLAAISHGEALIIMVMLFLATLSRMMRGAISPIYRGRQAYATGVMVDVGYLAVLVIVVILSGSKGVNPVGIASLYFVVDLLVGWGLMLLDIRCRWPLLRFQPAVPTWAELSAIARQVRWLAIQQGAPTAWLQLPVVMLGTIGATGASLVSFILLRTLANFARQVSSMLSLSSGIEMANIHYSGQGSDVARELQLLGRILSAVSAGMVAWIALYGETFVLLWTGRADLFDVTIAASLFGAMLATSPASPIASFAVLGGFPRATAAASTVQLAVGLSACALLAGPYGVPGAAIGLAIGEIIGIGLVLPLLTARHTGLRYMRYAGECILSMAVVALFSLGVGAVLAFALAAETKFGVLVQTGLWCCLGLVPGIYFSLPELHRAKVLELVCTRVRGFWLRLASRSGAL